MKNKIYVIWKYEEGISLNGKEFLLNNDGDKFLAFESPEIAVQKLKELFEYEDKKGFDTVDDWEGVGIYIEERDVALSNLKDDEFEFTNWNPN